MVKLSGLWKPGLSDRGEGTVKVSCTALRVSGGKTDENSQHSSSALFSSLCSEFMQ